MVPLIKRLVIVAAATILQICLGTMYAWSYFQSILIKENHWSHTEATVAFSLLIFLFGFSCAWAGFNVKKLGPRRLATIGGILYGASFLAGSLALYLDSKFLFFLGFSVLGGVGSGLAYVTPVSTVARWFPGKPMATSVVLMGFGLGAFIMSKLLAPQLLYMSGGRLDEVFLGLGVLLSAVLVGAAYALQEAPPGYHPDRPAPEPEPAAAGAPALSMGHPGAYLWSVQFVTLWLLFFFITSAGIAVISFQSGLIQEIWARADSSVTPDTLARYGATMIGVSSLFNAAGRLGWPALSGWTGQIGAYRLIMASLMMVFGLMLTVQNPWLFGALVCYVLSCFGGAFGLMPPLVQRLYGAERLPVVFGTLLTGFSAAGIAGPLLVAALQDASPDRALAYAFLIAVAGLGLGFAVSFLLVDRSFRPGKPGLDELGLLPA